jgi:hypothetical protein
MNGKYRVIEFRPGTNPFYHFRGMSTYPKPVSTESLVIGFGSECYEIDTQNIFMYDSDNDAWIQQ